MTSLASTYGILNLLATSETNTKGKSLYGISHWETFCYHNADNQLSWNGQPSFPRWYTFMSTCARKLIHDSEYSCISANCTYNTRYATGWRQTGCQENRDDFFWSLLTLWCGPPFTVSFTSEPTTTAHMLPIPATDGLLTPPQPPRAQTRTRLQRCKYFPLRVFFHMVCEEIVSDLLKHIFFFCNIAFLICKV